MKPPVRRARLPVVHAGITYPTKRALARFLGIQERTVSKRLSKGRPPDVAGYPRNLGGTISSNGYRRFSVDGENVYEHRRVMEKRLGRKLLPHEAVHHLNGTRSDNRDENLELWSTFQPCGQRVADKVRWAREVMRLYGDYP